MTRQTTCIYLLFLLSACNHSANSDKQKAFVEINTLTDTVISDNTNGINNNLPLNSIDTVFGKSPLHNDLSNTMNFQSAIKRVRLKENFDSCIVTVSVTNKQSAKNIFTVHFTSGLLVTDSAFMNDNVRSFITGKNKHAQVVDNDFGDIVVADFNFDTKEDFAVKRDDAGNGGPLYNFYIQQDGKTFILDKFLSDTMIWFPSGMNKQKNTLTTLVRASAVNVSETIYKLDLQKKKWIVISRRLIGY